VTTVPILTRLGSVVNPTADEQFAGELRGIIDLCSQRRVVLSMTRIFLALAIVSGGVALGGLVWSFVAGLRARQAEALAAEEAREETPSAPDEAAAIDVVDVPPVGADRIEEHAGFSLAGAGWRVRREGWRRALPILLVAGGMLALLVFGALALLTSLPSKLFGLTALGIAIYISVTELCSFSKAVRD
jgi:hypothetical protein